VDDLRFRVVARGGVEPPTFRLGGLSRPRWPEFVLSIGESSPVLSVVFGVRVSKSVSKIVLGNRAGLRTDPKPTRWEATRCDAGTAGHDTGLKVGRKSAPMHGRGGVRFACCGGALVPMSQRQSEQVNIIDCGDACALGVRCRGGSCPSGGP
jgi:hypothetical protein